MAGIVTPLRRLLDGCRHALSARLTHLTKPLTSSLPLQTLTDLSRSKSELVAANALLRQQLIILRRQVKRPACTKTDRMLLVLLTRLVRTWQQALMIVQPDTVLRWPRELFRLFWKRKSKAASHKPKVAAETIALIRQMATENRRLRCRAHSRRIVEIGHWGVQADHPEVHEDGSFTPATRSEVVDRSRAITPTKSGRVTSSRSATCSFDRSLPSSSSNGSSRKVIPVGVTRSPTDAWTAQQLREATRLGASTELSHSRS